MIVVTSYDSPDIDGIACAIGYSELLGSLGSPAMAVYTGDLGLEVEFVKKQTGFFPLKPHSGQYHPDADFILVDSADPGALDPNLPIDRVVKIIDHHPFNYQKEFINANFLIEPVGSCATLITEEFQKNKKIPSKNTAVYLYSAIVSNTVNFKNPITTDRDIAAAEFLKPITGLGNDFIQAMFIAKSQITPENLYQYLNQDFAIKTIAGKKIGIGQLEIVNLDRFSSELNQSLTDALKRLKQENKLDYIIFVGVDIIKGFDKFFTIDSSSTRLLAKALGIPKLTSGYQTETIIMRKVIWPKIESAV